MPSLQVRDVPEALFVKLKQAAERDHRSLAQETVAILEKGLKVEKTPKSRRKDLLAEIKSYQPDVDTKSLESPVKLIREDRQR